MTDSASIDALFSDLWQTYASITPQAHRIHGLLADRGEQVRNDHIAFRTFDQGPFDLNALAQPFVALGYIPTGEYHFAQKKLDARSFSHPSGQHPRVFISQLRVSDMPAPTQALLQAFIAQIPPGPASQAIRSAIDWPLPSHAQYLELAKVSEYAAWVSAFGLRVNHFTVSVNALKTFEGLIDLNAFLEAQGIRLSGDARKIQGDPSCGLEQSSTVADRITWSLQDQRVEIPSCYYEFAKRHPLAGQSELFDGFVTQSADKIFESTDRRHHERST